MSTNIDPLGAALANFMALYPQARRAKFNYAHPAVDALREAAALIEDLLPRSLGPNAFVRWSVGQGNWAAVPWISVLGVAGVETTQSGVYPVLLFQENLEAIELTIAQGVTKPKRDLGRRAAIEVLHDRANALRPEFRRLARSGFAFDNKLDLGRSPLGRDYVESAVVHQRYRADDLPTSTISNALARLLRRYGEIANDGVLDRIDGDGAEPTFDHDLGPRALMVYAGSSRPPGLDAISSTAYWGWDEPEEELSALRPGDLITVASGFTGRANAALTRWPAQRLRNVTVGRLLGPLERTSSTTTARPSDAGARPWQVRFEVIAHVSDVPLDADHLSAPALTGLRNSALAAGEGFVVPVEGSTFLEAFLAVPGPPPSPSPRAVADAAVAFVAAVRDSGLLLDDADVAAFFAALASKPFAILTGLSGSGKTQLALRLGEWFGTDAEGRSRMLPVPVRPDWTSPESLFGYEDTLRSSKDAKVWSVPDTLEFIMRAHAEPNAPHLLVLDEMNLAHVERYFADFLSGLESSSTVLPEVHRNGEQWEAVGNTQRLAIPRNLLVVGTVNVDETTYLFSPKVLDRAFTFEFRVTTDQLDPDASKPRPIGSGAQADLDTLTGLLHDDQWHRAHPAAAYDQIVEELIALHQMLSQSHHEFGHRVLYESMRYAAVLSAVGITDATLVLDRVVLTKILPKLHGTRARLQPTLEALLAFAQGGQQADDPLLPRSADKLERMLSVLIEAQFVSFTE
jgi:hypothetical protein